MLDVVVDMGGISIESSAPGRRERKASGDTFHLDFGTCMYCLYVGMVPSYVVRYLGVGSEFYHRYISLTVFPSSQTHARRRRYLHLHTCFGSTIIQTHNME